MMKMLLVILGLVGSLELQAQGRRKHRAHEHGALNLSLVVEGKSLTAELKGAADGIVGFEHEPTDDKERQQREAALTTLRDNISKILGVDSTWSCEVKRQDIKVEAHSPHRRRKKNESKHHAEHNGEAKSASERHPHKGEHAEINASFLFSCQQDLAGKELQLDFSKVFPAVKTVRVVLLSAAKQEPITVKKFPTAIKL